MSAESQKAWLNKMAAERSRVYEEVEGAESRCLVVAQCRKREVEVPMSWFDTLGEMRRRVQEALGAESILWRVEKEVDRGEWLDEGWRICDVFEERRRLELNVMELTSDGELAILRSG